MYFMMKRERYQKKASLPTKTYKIIKTKRVYQISVKIDRGSLINSTVSQATKIGRK